jgi:hypothetical protein
MRLAESVRLATWSTRRPFAFLESVDVSDAGVGDRQTARFILTGRGDEPIVGAPVRIVVSGAAEADALVLTDSRGLAELSYLADQVGDVIVRAVATVDGAHVYNSEMAVTGHVVDSPLAFWSRVWLDREPETNRVRVYAESLAEEPSSWVIRYRTSPGHWLSVSGQGRSSDGLLATIDEREVWPGTCPVVVTAENPGRQTSQLVWFDASRGRLAGLLADADPPVERDGESWSELVLTFDGRAYMVFGTLPGSDLSGGIVDASVVRWLAYGRPPEDKP